MDNEGKKIDMTDIELKAVIREAVAAATATPATLVEHIQRAIETGKTAEEIIAVYRTNDPYVSYLQDNLRPELAESVAILVKSGEGEVETPHFGLVNLAKETRGRGENSYDVLKAEVDLRGQLVVQKGRDGMMTVNISLPVSNNIFGGQAVVFKVRESTNIQGWSGRYGSEPRRK